MDKAEVAEVLSEYLHLNREVRTGEDAPKLVERLVKLEHPHLPAPFEHLDAFMSLDALIAADFFDDAPPDAEQHVIEALSDLVLRSEDQRRLAVVCETLQSLWEAHCNLSAAAHPWYQWFPPWPGQRRRKSTELVSAVREFVEQQARHVAAMEKLINQQEP